MAGIQGIDPKHPSFLMRQVFKRVRKMLGRDLTPMKIQARVPRLFWFGILGQWILGEKAKVPSRLENGQPTRTAVRNVTSAPKYFTSEQLLELTANAALENYRARFNRVFDVGSDGLYRKGLRFKQHTD